jgi:hypothetical protein
VDDLMNAMTEADVLDTFCHLPPAAQADFVRWVSIARDDESHRRRIDALVLAMRSGLLHADLGGAEAVAQRVSE